MGKRALTFYYPAVFLMLIFFCPGLKACASVSALKDEYCAFCNPTILERQKFFEDDLVIVLYTHKPIVSGHCLIIPKRHVQRFEELSDIEASRIMQVIKKVHQTVQSTFDTSSYLLLQKNGREADQTVPHVHFHYIPREAGETSSLKFMLKMYIANVKNPMDAQEMRKVVLKLKEAMKKDSRSL